jgi:hypothetical protein
MRDRLPSLCGGHRYAPAALLRISIATGARFVVHMRRQPRQALTSKVRYQTSPASSAKANFRWLRDQSRSRL